MKHIFYIIIVGVFAMSCKTQISDAPHIEWLSQSADLDSVFEDSTIAISFRVISHDAPLRKIQVTHAKSILFDTVVSHVNEFEYTANVSFADYKDIQTIQVLAYDTEDLYSSVSKQFYVKELLSPQLSMDTSGVYRDTAIVVNTTLKFDIRCVVGQRPLDSLIVYQNSIVTYRYPAQVSQVFTDSVTKVPYSYSFNTVGTYIVMMSLRDKASKTAGKQIKVTVTE